MFWHDIVYTELLYCVTPCRGPVGDPLKEKCLGEGGHSRLFWFIQKVEKVEL